MLRTFKQIATLVEIEVERPPDARTDFAGGAAAAQAMGMKRLAERLARTARGELNCDDVPILHGVVAALQAQGAAITRAGVAARVDQFAPTHYFGADEALLNVCVDLPGSVPGREPVAQMP